MTFYLLECPLLTNNRKIINFIELYNKQKSYPISHKKYFCAFYLLTGLLLVILMLTINSPPYVTFLLYEMCEAGYFPPSLIEHSTSNVLFLHDLLKLQCLGDMTDQFIFQLKLTVTLFYLCLTDSDASLHHNQSSISVTLSSFSSLWISDKYAVAPSFSCSPALTFKIAPCGTFRNLRDSRVFFTCCVKFASLSNILISKCIF